MSFVQSISYNMESEENNLYRMSVDLHRIPAFCGGYSLADFRKNTGLRALVMHALDNRGQARDQAQEFFEKWYVHLCQKIDYSPRQGGPTIKLYFWDNDRGAAWYLGKEVFNCALGRPYTNPNSENVVQAFALPLGGSLYNKLRKKHGNV